MDGSELPDFRAWLSSGGRDAPPLPFVLNMEKRKYKPGELRVRRSRSFLRPAGEVIDPPPPPLKDPRLAAYLRISQLGEDSAAIWRQLVECVGEIDLLGGLFNPETDIFVDVDVSAYQGVYREGLETLLGRIVVDRAYDGVVVRELTRALRRQAESFNLKKIFVQNSCDLHVVNNRQIGLWGPRAVFFDFAVNLAETESRTMGERQSSRMHQLSMYGAPRSKPVFGMKAVDSDRRINGRGSPIRMVVPDEDPREVFGGRSPAEMVRSLIDDVLSGRTVRSVAVEWNDLGYPAPRGGQFSGNHLSRILASPVLAGLAHRGYQLLRASDGELLQPGSDDEPLVVGVGLVDVEVWMRVVAMYESRKQHPRGANESGLGPLLWCGRCGSKVHRGGTNYQCSDHKFGDLLCGSMNTMRADLIEPFVCAFVVELLKSRDLRLGAAATNAGEMRPLAARVEAEIAALGRTLDEVERVWFFKTADKDKAARERFDRHHAEVQDRLKERKSKLAALSTRARSDQLSRLYTEDRPIEEAFYGAPRHVQVSVLLEVLDRVVLHARAEGVRSRKFDPGRIEIVPNAAWSDGVTPVRPPAQPAAEGVEIAAKRRLIARAQAGGLG